MLGSTALSDLAGESIRTNDDELWCNQVAAELLVPMDEFRLRFDPQHDLRDNSRPLDVSKSETVRGLGTQLGVG